MANKLLWSYRALIEYDKLLEYLYGEWGEDITLRVVKEIENAAIRIKNSPGQFPVFLKTRKIHRCVLSPQTSIFFKVNSDGNVEIISLFDNRQSPKKRKL